MPQMTLKVHERAESAVTEALDGFRYRVFPGAAIKQSNGSICTGYIDGLMDSSVGYREIRVEWDGPELTWFDHLQDVPMCEDEFSVVPTRWMLNGSSKVPAEAESPYARLHGLQFRHRRTGDRVLVPIAHVYAAALSFGPYVPKGTEQVSTADRVQELLFNVNPVESPLGVPLPAIHGNSNYHDNLRFITSYPFCHARDIPAICSMMTLADEKPSKYIGEIGVRGQFRLAVDHVFGPFPGDYGDRYKCVMSDPDGNRVIWWTGENCDLKQGESYDVRATPTKYDNDDGVATTFVNRVTRLDKPKTRRKRKTDATAVSSPDE